MEYYSYPYQQKIQKKITKKSIGYKQNQIVNKKAA